MLAAALLVAGCAGPPSGPVDDATVTLPPPGAVVSYQLGGAYDPPAGTGVVVRDSTGRPADGVYSVCYVNAFQTQPGADLDALEDLLLHDGEERVVDPDWPDEVLYDTSTPRLREQVAELVGRDLDRCATAGFDAVELDNLDAHTRSHGLLDAQDGLDLAALLVRAGHDRGLAVAQKNLAELVDDAAAAGFDLAVVEECAQFEECDAWTDAYGDRVYAVEYTDAQDVPFTEACERWGDRLGLVLRDRDLLAAGDDGHVERRCP